MHSHWSWIDISISSHNFFMVNKIVWPFNIISSPAYLLDDMTCTEKFETTISFVVRGNAQPPIDWFMFLLDISLLEIKSRVMDGKLTETVSRSKYQYTYHKLVPHRTISIGAQSNQRIRYNLLNQKTSWMGWVRVVPSHSLWFNLELVDLRVYYFHLTISNPCAWLDGDTCSMLPVHT